MVAICDFAANHGVQMLLKGRYNACSFNPEFEPNY